jgi:hypothetical protein
MISTIYDVPNIFMCGEFRTDVGGRDPGSFNHPDVTAEPKCHPLRPCLNCRSPEYEV